MSFVYILRCCDNSLYVGYTTDLVLRLRKHNEGFASSFTAKRRPVRSVYSETFESLEAAIARERQLKRWTTKKKEALIAGDLTKLRQLSRCRNR